MTGFLFLLIGLLIGGGIAAGFLCCMQVNRIAGYERELERLRQRVNQLTANN